MDFILTSTVGLWGSFLCVTCTKGTNLRKTVTKKKKDLSCDHVLFPKHMYEHMYVCHKGIDVWVVMNACERKIRFMVLN